MIADHGQQSQIIADYVLDLLPPERRAALEDHLARCEQCRIAVGRERALVAQVQQTLAHAGRPASDRLQQLMPAAPARHPSFRTFYEMAWRPATALALLLVLFLGVLQSDLLLGHQRNDAILSSPSTTALVVTTTTTPTATQIGAARQDDAYGATIDPAPLTLAISPPPVGTRLVAFPAAKGNP